MKRGDVWTVAGGPGLASKPRPALIVQSDAFAETSSVAICMFTSDDTEAPAARLQIEPSDRNGLLKTSRVMVDKVVTVPRACIGKQIGRFDDADMEAIDRLLIVFLGLAD